MEVEAAKENPKAHLTVEEKYYELGTTEFDVCDEYFLIDGILYIREYDYLYTFVDMLMLFRTHTRAATSSLSATTAKRKSGWNGRGLARNTRRTV